MSAFASAASLSSPEIATFAPSATNARAIAAPIPRDPPVMMATRPSSGTLFIESFRGELAAGSRPLHLESAVDVVDRTGDVARLVFQQEPDDARHLLGFAEPAHRDLLHDQVQGCLRYRGYHLGFDETGRDAVHGNAFSRSLEREALGA